MRGGLRVSVHIDDMGATPEMTRRIAGAWDAGLVDGFSVMANGDGLAEMMPFVPAFRSRGARVAVHLNLSEGRPLSAPADVPLLVTPDGHLWHTFGSLTRGWMTGTAVGRRDLLAQIEREWRRQIEGVVASFGAGNVRAVDSHIHVHMLPFLFPIAARLAREYDIPEIRVVDEPLHFSRPLRENASRGLAVNLAKHATLRFCATWPRRVARQHGLSFPDRIVGVLYTGRMTASSARAGVVAAERAGAGSVEVIFHIGRAADAERSRWTGNPAVGAFPLDPARDLEHLELQRFRAPVTA